jgi:hypothetical protein
MLSLSLVSPFTPVKFHGKVAHENFPEKGLYLKSQSYDFFGRGVFAGEGFYQHP